jgi:magnesium-transporting ATPase (P-type)
VQPIPNPQSEPGGLPLAPPVQLPPDPGAQPIDTALRRVIILMFINLGLSVVTTLITLLLRTSVLDYQLAHAHIPAGASPADIDVIRQALETALWTKLVVTVLVAGLYIWRAFALRRGSRGAYLRLYYICVAGIVGIAYLILAGQYPVWMRVEQGLQAVVLVALLIAVSRKEVRYRFAKQRFA